MYRHIQLANRGALPAQSIENLGQIVVVCGKNNSGKTTLLQAIAEGAQYLKPGEISMEPFAACIRYQMGGMWDHAINPIVESIKNVPRYKDLWLEVHKDEFVTMVVNEFNSRQFMGASPPTLDRQEVVVQIGKQLS